MHVSIFNEFLFLSRGSLWATVLLATLRSIDERPPFHCRHQTFSSRCYFCRKQKKSYLVASSLPRLLPPLSPPQKKCSMFFFVVPIALRHFCTSQHGSVFVRSTAFFGASSCSPDFGVGGVSDRLGQISPKLVFFSLEYVYASRWHDCRELALDVLARLPGE